MARIIERVIIIAGVFVSLTSIPYIIRIENTNRIGSTKQSTATSTPASRLSEITVAPIVAKPQSEPATLPKTVLPAKTEATIAATSINTGTLPDLKSKYGALLEEELRLGIVNPRDEQELWRGVVAVQCSYELPQGGYKSLAGSGIILDAEGHVATNNHVANHEPNGNCQVSFPAFSENTDYSIRTFGTLPARVINASGNNDNDIALLKIQKTADFESQLAYWKKYYGWTGDPFSFIPYPFCHNASAGDKILHFDWQVINTASQGYEIIRTVSTVIEFLRVFKDEFYYARPGQTPDYIVTDAKKFGGSSGGLAFNASRDCILGLTSRSGDATYVLNISHPNARQIIQF